MRNLITLLLLSALTSAGFGQNKAGAQARPDVPSSFVQNQDDLNTLKDPKTTDQDRTFAVNNLVNITQHNPQRFIEYSVNSDLSEVLFLELVRTWQQARVDQQGGPSATSAFGTDLVSRPGLPTILGAAVQAGALTQTTSGSAATFSGNADSLVRTLSGLAVVCQSGCYGTPFLKGLDFAVSFDTARQGQKTLTTSGAATTSTTTVPGTVLLPSNVRQLSNVTVRYNLFNPKDPRSKDFHQVWEKWFQVQSKTGSLLATTTVELNKAVSDLFRTLDNDADFISLRQKARSDLLTASQNNKPELIDSILNHYYADVYSLAKAKIPDFGAKLLAVRGLYARYASVYKTAINGQRDANGTVIVPSLNGPPQWTFEYTFDRPVDQPDIQTVRLIYGQNLFNGPGLFTANLAGSFYTSVPGNATYGRVRAVQFAGQFDRPLGDIITHPATLTLAGYYQYQFDPSVLKIGPGNLVPGTSITLPGDASVLLGKSGSMGIIQGKVTLDMKGSGLKVPIAISWASRTELLDANEVRGQIGLTYNFDSLFPVK